VYFSFWGGKVVNSFIKHGQKQLIEQKFKHIYYYLKMVYKILPIEMILEGIERIKPLFVGHYILRYGQKEEYPRYLGPFKQRQTAIY
jgi:hypothetical protein